MFWILLAAGLWLLSGVAVFITIMLGAWHYGRRKRLEITPRPEQVPPELASPQASAGAV